MASTEGMVVMVGASETDAKLLAERLSGQYRIQSYTGNEALCRALDDDPEMADVIVLAYDLPRPFNAAPGILARARDAALLILCRPENERDYTHRLRVTPHMDRRVQLLPIADDTELSEWVSRLGDKVRQRRRYRRTLAAAQQQLDNGQRPRHPVNHYLEQLLEHLPVGIVNVDTQGQLRSFNRAARRLLAVAEEPAPDTPVRDLFSPSARQAVTELLDDADAGSSARPHVTLEDADGQSRIIELSKTPVANYGGEPIIILMLQDVTETQNLLDGMRHDASHDALTGLINRRELRTRLTTALVEARRQGENHILCYMDLDDFKRVNDSAGHQGGDEMLRRIAELMKRCCRERDSLARWGGDEFVLLLANCSMDNAERVAGTLVNRVTGFEFQWNGRTYRVGISIGIAPVRPATENVNELLAAADKACYAAKQQGGNRVSRSG